MVYSPLDRRTERTYQLGAGDPSLTFVVRIARTEADLQLALDIRRRKYANHHPTLAELLAYEDKRDRQAGSIVFLAKNKLDGRCLGSVRLETNISRPLQIERDVVLPSKFRRARLLHVTRFAVESGSEGIIVKRSLLKAMYLYSRAKEIDFALISTIGLSARLFYRIGFKDVFPANRHVRLGEYGGLEVKLLAQRISLLSRNAKSLEGDEMRRFINEFRHPDIQIFDSVSSSWEQPRQV